MSDSASATGPPIRRRIDRVTSPDFLTGLPAATPAQLRTMRDECREEESRLSYVRRLLHGQMDVARAELTRRDAGGTQSLITALGEVLADPQRPGAARSAANSITYDPSGESGHRVGDGVLDHLPLHTLPDMSDDDLVAAVTKLAEDETVISALRRTVLDHLDRLQAELILRYRDGATSAHDVVPRSEG